MDAYTIRVLLYKLDGKEWLMTKEALDVFGAKMIVSCDTSDLPLFMCEHIVPPGYMVPPHYHEEDDEVFYILSGEVTLFGPDGESKAGPGEVVKLPHGGVHGFGNTSDKELRFILTCLPGKQSVAMFRELDRAGKDAPLTPDKIVTICAAHGTYMK